MSYEDNIIYDSSGKSIGIRGNRGPICDPGQNTAEVKKQYLKLDDKYEHALRKIDDMQSLLTRAADALEKVASYASGDPDSYRVLRLPEQQLISELRKAAE